jgi:hypothetical protein
MTYDDVKPKWIIENGRLIIGKVKFHSQLVADIEKVKGGGLFDMDHEAKTILLYGSSSDYGYAAITDIIAAIQDGSCDSFHREGQFNNFEYSYSTHFKLEEARATAVAISKVKLVKEDES